MNVDVVLIPLPIPQLLRNQLLLEALGRVIVILAAVFVSLVAIALLLCYYMLNTGKIVSPNLALFLMDLFYEPLTRLLSFFRIDPTIIDRVLVEIRNALNYPAFCSTRLEDRVLLLPQCLRDVKCPARLSSIDGIHCVECGRCVISKISAICKQLGVKMYIAPGGTFAKRILMHSKPKAVVGVACYSNLYEGMLNASLANIPAQGVPLAITGCVNTAVDYAEIINKLVMGAKERAMIDRPSLTQ
jgi:hypothetical protein